MNSDLNEQFIFQKNYGQYLKLATTEKNTKLFGIRVKLSYYIVFHRKYVGYRNEKNSDTHE